MGAGSEATASIESYALAVSAGQRSGLEGSPALVGEFGHLRDSINRMLTLLDCRYQDLQGSNERFWALLKNYPHALGLYSPTTGKIAFINHTFTQLFGYTLEDVPDAAAWFTRAYPDEAYRDEVKKTWSAMLEVACENAVPVETREYRVRCQSGMTRVVEIGGVLTDDMVLVVFSDVTERRRAEGELAVYHEHLEESVMRRTEELERARDAAETANRAKSSFLANMSHELRTPLNSVIGFSQMMVKDPHLTAKQKRNLGMINTSGNHLLSLINDILELSKIDAGKMALAEKPIDLPGLLAEVTAMLRVRAAEAGLQLVLVTQDLPDVVMADAPKLRQVLLNLLSNAIKFTSHGRVFLAAEASQEDERVLVHFSVTDSGVGVAEADQRRVFEPFIQVGEHARHQGTGLGLTVSRQYVEMMGGRLDLQSALGKGSTFSFSLALRRANVLPFPVLPQPGHVVGLAPGTRPVRILLAEDGPETRILLADLLAFPGIEVSEAEDGQQAEDAILAHQPDLVLMDWRMPVRDGLEVTRRIRSTADLQQPRIIMLTAHAFEENRSEALASGADDFMRKPIDADLLYSLLEKHLDIRFQREVGADDMPDDLPRGLPTELDPADVEKLSHDLRERLIEAVRELNPVRIGEVLDAIEHESPALAETLRRLVSAMQYRHLWQVLGIVV